MPHDDIPEEKAGGLTPASAPESAVPESAPVAQSSPDLSLPPVPTLDTGYTADGVPTFDGVREKIENRYGTALGSTELAEDTVEVRTAADQFEARRKAAAAKLDEIRASMHDHDGPGSGKA